MILAGVLVLICVTLFVNPEAASHANSVYIALMSIIALILATIAEAVLEIAHYLKKK
jgi:hypothetical protein